MALISTDIPNLTGGVSQQPDSMRLVNQCETQENAISSPVEGLLKRPPTEYVKKLINGSVPNDFFVHHVNRDSSEQYFVVCDGGNDSDTIKVFDMQGNAKTVSHDPEGDAPETGYAYMTTSTPSTSLKAVTIADVTFFLNTEKTVAMDSAVSTYSRNLIAKPNEALIVVKRSPGAFSKCKLTLRMDDIDLGLVDADSGGSSDFGYNANVQDGHDAIFAADRIRQLFNSGSFLTEDTDNSGDIDSNDNQTAITTTSTAAGTNLNVVFITGSRPFNLTASDGQGNTILQVIQDEVENFADLPSIAQHDMVIKVIGDPESEVDDYYVKFKTDNGQPGLGQGRWSETTAGGIKNSFNFTTMPHILVRLPDGNFLFTAADGQFNGSTSTSIGTGSVDLSSFKFGQRLVGDELTNPKPTFVDNKISGLAFFKNRLAFLSGENVIMSEVGEYFNFFRTTTAQLLDSAVIDIAVGGTSVSNLKHAVPFSNRLLLFSDTSQFSLQGEQFLSPLTASITSQTEFEITETTQPIVSGSNLFFGFPRGSFNGIKQFFKVNEVDIQFDAVEVTAQVPKYIQGNIKKLAATTHEDMLFALTDTDASSLYCFKYFESQGRRLVSSWSKFTFGGTIYSMSFIDTTLFILIKRGSDLYLEKIRMETGLSDLNSTYTTTIDQRVYRTTGTYDSADNKTRWEGFEYTPSANSHVVTDTGLDLEVTDRSAGVVKVKGDFSGVPVYIGEPYTMKYEVSKPIIKSTDQFGNQRLMPSTSQNRHQLRYMTVIFSDTAYFNVKVTPEYHNESNYYFSGRTMGDSSSPVDSIPSVDGDFRVPIFAQSDRVKIEFINDSPLPSNFQAIQFEAELTTRTRQR